MITILENAKKFVSKFWLVLLTALALLPHFASAQFGGIDTFVGNVITFINSVLIPVIFAIALVVFIWGMFLYFIAGGGDESKREKGKGLMLWSIIAFVIMVVIVAVVNLLAEGLISGMGSENESFQTLPKSK